MRFSSLSSFFWDGIPVWCGEGCTSHRPAEDVRAGLLAWFSLLPYDPFVHPVTPCLIGICVWGLKLSLNLVSPLIFPAVLASPWLLWLSPGCFHTLPITVVHLPYPAAVSPMLHSLALNSMSMHSRDKPWGPLCLTPVCP